MFTNKRLRLILWSIVLSLYVERFIELSPQLQRIVLIVTVLLILFLIIFVFHGHVSEWTLVDGIANKWQRKEDEQMKAAFEKVHQLQEKEKAEQQFKQQQMSQQQQQQ